MPKSETSVEARIRGLSPLRFQNLAISLARREYGAAVEEVRDTDGEGNGCDGVLESVASVHAFQVKTVTRRFGPTQRQGVKRALSLAARKIPLERSKPLRRMTFLFNFDMAPSRPERFAMSTSRCTRCSGRRCPD